MGGKGAVPLEQRAAVPKGFPSRGVGVLLVAHVLKEAVGRGHDVLDLRACAGFEER